MTLHDEIAREVAAGTARVGALASVATAAFLGVDMQTWVYITAIVGGVLQIGYVGWKWFRDWKRSRNKPDLTDEAGA